MQEKRNVFTLQEKFSIDAVPSLWEEIKKLKKSAAFEIDLKNTRSIDSSGIAFINHLKTNYPNAGIKNMNPEFEGIFSMFPPAAKKEERKKQTLSGKIILSHVAHSMGHRMDNLDARIHSTTDNWKTFFVLLADEIFYTFQYLFKGRGIYPGEIGNQLFFMAYKSYPIVSLISFLVGITISLTSASLLRTFGADIYLADLIGYGMVRELVPLMTGIILAGKIGASITAEIASMKVMEETDALKTMGVIPEKFLMVPRLLAITMAIPLLVAIADIIGILGGFIIGRVFSGIPPVAFYNEMMTVVDFGDFLIGLGKTMVFGWVIVFSSGFKGFSVKRGAAGVGIATTESVVLSISLIIIADCVFALALY